MRSLVKWIRGVRRVLVATVQPAEQAEQSRYCINAKDCTNELPGWKCFSAPRNELKLLSALYHRTLCLREFYLQ